MGRTVLLRHELPDGSAHYDWMIQREGENPGELITFRVRERIDGGGVGAFSAERVGDHRGAYLEYEGPVSGGRGTVRRVATGEMAIARDGEAEFECAGRLGDAVGRFRGRRRGQDWLFEFVAGS